MLAKYFQTLKVFVMIQSFNDKITEEIWNGEKPKSFSTDLIKQSLKKLRVLNNVDNIEQLRIPPGNRLEKLTGDRKDQWSIRINDQFRICFEWENMNAYKVQIIDYH